VAAGRFSGPLSNPLRLQPRGLANDLFRDERPTIDDGGIFEYADSVSSERSFTRNRDANFSLPEQQDRETRCLLSSFPHFCLATGGNTGRGWGRDYRQILTRRSEVSGLLKRAIHLDCGRHGCDLALNTEGN